MKNMQDKTLPIGTQHFPTLMENNQLYVDKTENIYELITSGRIYFFARPRRFGKSLLISTLEAIFQAKKELFNNLWIKEKSDYQWIKYPVIKIDFSAIPNENAQALEQGIHSKIDEISRTHKITLIEKPLKLKFRELVKKLYQKYKNKVVLLIDEYDKPIIDHINNLNQAEENKEIIRSFYGIIKPCDEYLKFVFITGISKFSQVSVFSDLNSLYDISMSYKYASLVGYKEEELEKYFSNHIKKLAKHNNLTIKETTEKIKYWYNGFRFSESEVKTYNPFSSLLLFNNLIFKYYWFATATPTFLIKLIKEQKYDIINIENQEVVESVFSSYDIEKLQVIPLLFQTGYLTINNYKDSLYKLGYPNFEVRKAFTTHLLDLFSNIESSLIDSQIIKLVNAINQDDLENFFITLQVFFANIPYELHLKEEKYYQTIFYMIFTLLNFNIEAESSTNKGRIDAVIKTKNKIYIFEFKLNDSADNALAQIKEREYYQKYYGKRKLTLIGVNFDYKSRNIQNWKIEDES